MPHVDDLIAALFGKKGYQVHLNEPVAGARGNAFSVPLAAVRDGQTTFVYWKSDAPLTGAETAAFASVVTEARAAGGVLIGLAGVSPDALAAPPGVEVWEPGRLVAEIGSAFLGDALSNDGGSTPAAPPAAQDAAAPAAPAPQRLALTPDAHLTIAAPRAPTPVSVERKFPSLIASAGPTMAKDPNIYVYKSKPKTPVPDDGGRPLAYAWSGAGASGFSTTPRALAEIQPGRATRHVAEIAHNSMEVVPNALPNAFVPAAPTAPSAPQASARPKWQPKGRPKRDLWSQVHAAAPTWTGPPAPPETLAVHVSKQDAATRAADRIGTLKGARLSLVPHIAFDYDAWVEAEALEQPLEGRGAVLVNALTGTMRDSSPVEFGTTLPEAASPPPEPKVQAVDIYEKVKGRILKQFSREMKVSREIAGVDVFENVKISPDVDDLGINHRGVVMVPVWSLSGDKGSVEMDAATGAILN